MAYNPALHTTSNKPYGTQNTPVDARSWFYDQLNYTYRPYNSISEVLSYLNTSASRSGNFSIFILDSGELKEYWFKDGVSNSDLVIKESEGGLLKRNVVVSNPELGIDLGTVFTIGLNETEVLEKLITRVSNPILTAPSFSLSNNINNPEVGSTINVTLTFNFNRGNILGNNVSGVWNPSSSQGPRAGASVIYKFYKGNGDLILETSNNTVTFSYTVQATNQFYAIVEYSEGIQPKDSDDNDFDTPYPAGISTDQFTSFTGIYPFFYYKSGNLITDSIMSNAIENGLATKVVANSSGTIILPYNAVGEFLSVAYPNTSTTKTKWFVTLLNTGDIPGGVFGEVSNIMINSPQGYWNNRLYKFHNTAGPITESNNYELRNN